MANRKYISTWLPLTFQHSFNGDSNSCISACQQSSNNARIQQLASLHCLFQVACQSGACNGVQRVGNRLAGDWDSRGRSITSQPYHSNQSQI